MKDQHTAKRALYQKSTRSGAGSVSEPSWKWWPLFSYLRAQPIVDEHSQSNVPSEPEPNDTSVDSVTDRPTITASVRPSTSFAVATPLESDSSSRAQTPLSNAGVSRPTSKNTTPVCSLNTSRAATPVSAAPKKKKRLDPIDSELKKVDELLDDDHSDEAALFGNSLAAKLRKFNPYQFALARRDIEKLLFDIEFGSSQYEQRNQRGPSPTNNFNDEHFTTYTEMMNRPY